MPMTFKERLLSTLFYIATKREVIVIVFTARKRILGKVMFLLLSMSFCSQGEGVCPTHRYADLGGGGQTPLDAELSGCIHPRMQTPLDADPLDADTLDADFTLVGQTRPPSWAPPSTLHTDPSRQTPLAGQTPLHRNPLRQTPGCRPPNADPPMQTPQDTSTSGWYASYWNAYLLQGYVFT